MLLIFFFCMYFSKKENKYFLIKKKQKKTPRGKLSIVPLGLVVKEMTTPQPKLTLPRLYVTSFPYSN